jgi:hypothetical protein
MAMTTSANAGIGSAILDHYRLKYIGRILAPVGGRFQHFINLFVFHQRNGIALFVEEIGNQFSHHFIGGIFQPVDLNAVFKRVAIRPEFAYGRSQPQSALLNDRGKG